LMALAVLPVVGFAVFWIVTIPAVIPASALAERTPDLANGKVMFYAGGCASCHATPGQQDPTHLGGGLPLVSPFGTFYPPNISPDRKDGIGTWSEADFVTALLKGTSPHGQHYYPAFPYPSYQHIKLDDARDLFAYLRTLPAVSGQAPPHQLPLPFRWRRLIGGWDFLFLDGKPFTPDTSKSAQWNRGAYLVNGPGHCAECHSPRNILGAIETDKRFAGGPDLSGKGWVPNITQKGLGDWSEEDIAYLLETGHTPDGDSVGGSMTEVIRNTSQLPGADREAIAVYLKSLPAVEGPPRPKVN
jgi:mono/diheme cytochrome c family protein